MKFTTAIASLALIGMTFGAVAQTAGTTKPGSTPAATSGATAKGTPDTTPAATSTPANSPTGTKAAPGSAPASTTSSDASAADQFKDEASAKAHCPTDNVVWANLNSKAYHASGTKYYGKTKHGAYVCQKDADNDGFHAAGTKSASAKTAH